MVFLPIGYKKKKQKRCTQLVEATCVALDPGGSESSRIEFNPEGDNPHIETAAKMYFRGQLNGVEIEFCNNVYTSPHPELGEKRQLFVNPQDPNDYYDPLKRSTLELGIIFFGIITLVFGIYSLIEIFIPSK
jgi:hypothetical protein